MITRCPNEQCHQVYKRSLKALLIIILLLFTSVQVYGFEGKVVSIADGDTISVMNEGVAQKVRLNGIDCPEKGQPFSDKAKQFTSYLVYLKVVTVKMQGMDKYSRTIADVFLPDGRSLNKALVESGYAWWYREYSSDTELKDLEQEARTSKRGLWVDSNPVPPWEWRRTARAKETTSPTKYQMGSSVGGTVTTPQTPSDKQIHTGPRGGRYHYSESGKKVYEKKK